MTQNRSRNHYSKIYGEDRKSWPPEVFLAVRLHELRNPIAVIRGWAQFLSNEETKNHIPEGIATIGEKIAILEKLHQGLEDYVSEHPPKPDP